MKAKKQDGGVGIPYKPSIKEVREFLRREDLCTFITVNKDGGPEGATVAFSVTNLGELMIGTNKDTNKSKNIDNNNRVAMVISNETIYWTVQITGLARKLDKTIDADLIKEHYLQRPESISFADKDDEVYILVEPKTLRFTDVGVDPMVPTEFKCD